MFSRLTRWFDRLIFFDFEVEHKPGAKKNLADYLSRNIYNPKYAAVPVSVYESMFTVAKINSILCALGYDQTNYTAGPVIASSKTQLTDNHTLCTILSENLPSEEGTVPCKNGSTNQK